MEIKAVMFDFIGTTVHEKIRDTIPRCFEAVFKKFNIQVDANFIEAHRGKNKREVFLKAIKLSTKQISLDAMLKAFEGIIHENLTNFSAAANAEPLFIELKKRNIKIGLGTGLTRDSFESILAHLNWSIHQFDYTATAEEVGQGRPHPDMILDMMKKLKINNPKHVLKIGDTVADIEEGKNAGVWTAALLSGTQSKEIILEAMPEFVLNDLPRLLELIDEDKKVI